MWLSRTTVAGAMVLGWSVIARPTHAAPTTTPAEQAPAVAPSVTSPISPSASPSVSPSAAPVAPPSVGGQVPAFDEIDSLKRPTPQLPVSTLSPETAVNNPTAPLPPALIAGPATMAIAGWISWRIRKRGGRI